MLSRNHFKGIPLNSSSIPDFRQISILDVVQPDPTISTKYENALQFAESGQYAESLKLLKQLINHSTTPGGLKSVCYAVAGFLYARKNDSKKAMGLWNKSIRAPGISIPLAQIYDRTKKLHIMQPEDRAVDTFMQMIVTAILDGREAKPRKHQPEFIKGYDNIKSWDTYIQAQLIEQSEQKALKNIGNKLLNMLPSTTV